jgi:predicted tellurium resistance membrane protein TerC
MIEICIINSTLNIIAMLLMIFYITKLHLVSNFKTIETVLYYILAMMCALRITTDLQYLHNPVKENYIILFPLIRNYIVVWVFWKFYKYQKNKL